MTAIARRSRVILALALWGIVVGVVGAIVGANETAGQGLNHAGLMIVFPDGRVESRCIEFSDDSISGAELLERSGLPVVFSGFGGLGAGVCRIDDVGCSDPGDCYCQCRGGDCHYWTYYALVDGEWRFQNVGPSTKRVHDGDVQAWVWGNGRTRPPPAEFAAMCNVEPTRPPPQPSATIAEPPGPQGLGAATPPDGSGGSTAQPTAQSGRTSMPERSTSAATPLTTPAAPEVRVGGNATGGSETHGSGSAAGGGGGMPAGLIAFGAVAGALTIGVGALLARRRLRG